MNRFELEYQVTSNGWTRVIVFLLFSNPLFHAKRSLGFLTSVVKRNVFYEL